MSSAGGLVQGGPVILKRDDGLDVGVTILDALECETKALADQLQVLYACMYAGCALDRETAAGAAARLEDMFQLACRLLLCIPSEHV
jgi:hypothetical protein